MNNDLLFQFETIIKDDGSLEIPINKFMQLRKEGYNKVLVEVRKSSKNNDLSYPDFNIKSEIKLMQVLPDEVVDKFLNSKGKLLNFTLRNDF